MQLLGLGISSVTLEHSVIQTIPNLGLRRVLASCWEQESASKSRRRSKIRHSALLVGLQVLASQKQMQAKYDQSKEAAVSSSSLLAFSCLKLYE